MDSLLISLVMLNLGATFTIYFLFAFLKSYVSHINNKFNALASDFKSFRSEMTVFKHEMHDFKKDMLNFKNEMLDFKDEWKKTLE